ncbi:LmeA family phospholipid-binding protein [Agromyces cerinus]|uniref:DUF2993 domain-containing protein n=1 Tax=Agromyces cerinus subsp. cerinus TaxID=232089 RepID=A0A1N6HGA3_9MICO|nr:DUF2993 domain-containing protein [Agromyces cerinus]SIO18792.1 Protein of unknown function [Agromyces cerinus subsp. cerinus]
MAKHGDEHDPGEAPEATGPVEPVENGETADAQPTAVVETGDDGSGATLVIETDASDEQPTEVIEPYPAPGASAGAAGAAGAAAAAAPAAADAEAAEPRERRRLSRAARIWIVVGVVLAVLVALVVVADIVARGIAEQRVAEEIEANLPDGVEGDVTVSIGGFSVIGQYLSGTMQHVELDAPDLTVEGAPIAVSVVAEGMPVDLEAPVDQLTATITADADSINQLITVAGVETGLTLGDGTVGYEGRIEIFGLPITYQVTATPVAAGDSVLLEPEGVEVGAVGASIDVSGVIERLLGGDPLEICIADRLPEGVQLESIAVTSGAAAVRLQADGLVLDSASLEQKGSCG